MRSVKLFSRTLQFLPNRPVPEKLKQRLEQEFKQVEVAVKRGAHVKGSGSVRVRVREKPPTRKKHEPLFPEAHP